MQKRWSAIILGAVLSVAMSAQAIAQQADTNFFRGKTVSYIVATGAGGGYDTYGRLLSRYLEKHLPGTRFLVRNVPGAGQIIGANTIYVARPDGLTIGTFNTGLIYAQMLNQQGVRFDLSKMSWVGKMAEEGRTLVLANNSGFSSLQDLLNADGPVRLGAAGIGSAAYIETRILADVLNLDVRLVTGFSGGDTELSMLRGEIAGVLGAASSHDDFVHRGDGKFVVSVAGERSAIPGVPQAKEFATDAGSIRLLSLVETLAELGRLTAGPPGIPAPRLAALRQAFMAAISDPGLRADAERLGIPIDPGHGEEVAEKVEFILDQPPELLALLRQAAQGE